MKSKIYAFVPCLLDEKGHHFNYHDYVGRAFESIKIKYIKIIPKVVKIKDLDNSWQKKIHGLNGKKTLYNNFIKPLYNILFFIRFFKKIKTEENNIIFLEYFTIMHLFSIFISLFLSRKKVNLWILYRTDLNQLVMEGKLHYFLHKMLKKVIGYEKINIFTDSLSLSHKFQKFFKQNIHVLPIPHVFFKEDKKKSLQKEIFCWWPGGSIRPEKGLDIIIQLANFISNNTSNVKMILAEACREKCQNTQNITFISDNVSQKEYQKWMQVSNFILLPYDYIAYKNRTSGIFVEAVASETIPLVTKNTWMAKELQRFNLQELIIDWHDTNQVIDYLQNLSIKKEIHQKLKIMTKKYHSFHSISGFVEEIKKHL